MRETVVIRVLEEIRENTCFAIAKIRDEHPFIFLSVSLCQMKFMIRTCVRTSEIFSAGSEMGGRAQRLSLEYKVALEEEMLA